MEHIIKILEKDDKPVGVVSSPSDTFEVIVDIREVSENSKLLGELVCFIVKEGNGSVLVLGQITEIKTENKWHEEPSFKGIIKRHGKLPNLSGTSDNRIAKINVQSSFKLSNQANVEVHKLANSPSTGQPVKKIDGQIMQKLVSHYDNLVCIGNAYDTGVRIPFWFKHFGKSKDDKRNDINGAGDAYHIGVFGRTGSGKTTTAANMILGYAKNNRHMSILILDPQEQFYEDNNVLPDSKFEDEIKKTGMEYHKYRVPADVILPNNAKIFSELLLNYGFIRKAFKIQTPEKRSLMAESIEEYINGRKKAPSFIIGDNADELLDKMLKRFDSNNYYLTNVYASGGAQLKRLSQLISNLVAGEVEVSVEAKKLWNKICSLFSERLGKVRLGEIINNIVSKSGNTIILNISGKGASQGMDGLETLYVKIIEDAIKAKGQQLYAKGKQSNCLVVLDEAHRYISTYSYDDGIKQLTTSIIDAVRTTRKYGIGYMFITQTIDSLHEEIRRQIRIFAFGYGLTSGTEFVKIKDIINDDIGARFYRSFIDPQSNNKYPFMFYGPISPLSFTGAPLFLEMNNILSDF